MKNDASRQHVDCHSISKENLEKEGLSISKKNISFQEILDRATVAKLINARKEFEIDKEKAEAERDIDRKIECEESTEKIDIELLKTKNTFQDLNIKKINDNVRKAIKESIEKIKSISNPLHEHLKDCIDKGNDGYFYKPPKPIEWHQS